jgi:hypothetical protein
MPVVHHFGMSFLQSNRAGLPRLDKSTPLVGLAVRWCTSAGGDFGLPFWYLAPSGSSIQEKSGASENTGYRTPVLLKGSSPSRVGDFGLISYPVEHAGEDFQAQVLLVS